MSHSYFGFVSALVLFAVLMGGASGGTSDRGNDSVPAVDVAASEQSGRVVFSIQGTIGVWDGSSSVQLINDQFDNTEPAWSPDGEKIAFTSYRNGTGEIYVMDDDGSSVEMVATGVEGPAWSPDGQRIVFITGGPRPLLTTVAVDGSDQQPIRIPPPYGVLGSQSPAWSPFGSRIAFAGHTDNGGWEILDIDLQSRVRNLTNDPAFYDWSPAYSPDGSSIVFSRMVYNCDEMAGECDSDLWVMDSDGSNQRQLTNTPEVWERNPRWSADGTTIAFAVAGSPYDRLWMMDADGTDRRHLDVPFFDSPFDWERVQLSRFGDVGPAHMFRGDVEWLADAGITKGCNPPYNTMYCPDKSVTRGQMAAFLVRALELTDDGGGNSFVDDNSSVFETDIAKLAAAGITKGCNPPTNDRFCPDRPVTRGQMAAFLVRALGYTNDGGGDLFTDDDGSIFESDIDKLATAGVTRGCNPPVNDRFCPSSNVTRGQMAAFLHRALESR